MCRNDHHGHARAPPVAAVTSDGITGAKRPVASDCVMLPSPRSRLAWSISSIVQRMSVVRRHRWDGRGFATQYGMKLGSELLRYQLPNVTIYEHTHFQGRSQVVTQGRYDDDPGADVDGVANEGSFLL
jgi:hypothetical protein